jgi:hypothetical protein
LPGSAPAASIYPGSALLLTPPSPPPFVQDAAATRIKDMPDIIDAAASGDIGIVRDHLIVDPDSVHKHSRSL